MSLLGIKPGAAIHQNASSYVHPSVLLPRILCLGLALAYVCAAGPSTSAAEFARAAKEALRNGQTVRAYLLYSQAAAEDPRNPSYAANRDALAGPAKLLSDAHLDSAPGPTNAAAPGAGLTDLSSGAVQQLSAGLYPPPSLQIPPGRHDLRFDGDDKSVISRVAAAYGVETIFDPSFDPQPGIRFELDDVSFRTAMQAVTDATDTFVFPISSRRIFVARDTQQNRSEYEPQSVVTIPLPDAVDPRQVAEAANAVRGALGLHGQIGIDTAGRAVILRDRVTKVRVAQSILEHLLLPKPQIALHMQLLEVDEASLYHYGVAWQTSFQLIPFGALSKLRQPILPALINNAIFLPFGGGLGLFGIGLADAQLFAMFTESSSRILYDTTLRAGDGQPASLHFGDKYPIPTSLSTATFTGAGNGIYSPLGQVTQEDLGLQMKITPHVHGNSDIGLDVETQFQTLGTLVLNTVPSINQREYKGNLILEEGQWAVVSGLNQQQLDKSKSGFPGLGDVPGLDLLFAEHTRNHTKTEVLILIKPQLLTPVPVNDPGAGISIGPSRGDRVIF